MIAICQENRPNTPSSLHSKLQRYKNINKTKNLRPSFLTFLFLYISTETPIVYYVIIIYLPKTTTTKHHLIDLPYKWTKLEEILYI